MSGSCHNAGPNHAFFLAERPRREKLSHRAPHTINPRNGDPYDKTKTYNDHPKFNFPRRKIASAKLFIYIENTILSQYSFVDCFLDTGDELVRSARWLHTQRHIIPNTSVTFLYISVGREKS